MATVVAALSAVAVPKAQGPQATSCGSNIISATVVATYCAHVEGAADRLDLLVLWRGHPGWFQSSGPRGNRGAGRNEPGARSHVTQYQTYGATTIGIDADFEARMVAIGETRIALDAVNAIFVDRVDEPGARTVVRHQLESRVELGVDPHLALARGSNAVRDFLQCQIPMPASPERGQPPTPVATVCDKLRAR